MQAVAAFLRYQRAEVERLWVDALVAVPDDRVAEACKLDKPMLTANDSKRVLDQSWIYQMTHPSFEDANTAYGYPTWLNARAGRCPKAIQTPLQSTATTRRTFKSRSRPGRPTM